MQLVGWFHCNRPSAFGERDHVRQGMTETLCECLGLKCKSLPWENNVKVQEGVVYSDYEETLSFPSPGSASPKRIRVRLTLSWRMRDNKDDKYGGIGQYWHPRLAL